MSKIVKKILKNLRNSIFYLEFFLKKLIFRSFCRILTKKGKNGNFLTFFTTFLQFWSIFGNFKTSNWVYLPKFSIVAIVTIVAFVATIGSRLSHCRNNIFDDNMIKCSHHPFFAQNTKVKPLHVVFPFLEVDCRWLIL